MYLSEEPDSARMFKWVFVRVQPEHSQDFLSGLIQDQGKRSLSEKNNIDTKKKHFIVILAYLNTKGWFDILECLNLKKIVLKR